MTTTTTYDLRIVRTRRTVGYEHRWAFIGAVYQDGQFCDATDMMDRKSDAVKAGNALVETLNQTTAF